MSAVETVSRMIRKSLTDLAAIRTTVFAAGQPARDAEAKVRLDHDARWEKMLREYKTTGGDLSTAQDPDINARLAKAKHDEDRAMVAESQTHRPAVLAMLEEKRRRVDQTWGPAPEARAELDTFEQELKTIPGYHDIRSSITSDIRSDDMRYRAWRERAWPADGKQ